MRILFIPCCHPSSPWLFRALLESGHSLVRAEDLSDGILFAAEERFDAIIATALDPRTQGELITSISDLASSAEGAAIVTVLHETTAAERVQIFHAGADACFSLPLSFLELHERLSALSRSRQGGPMPVRSTEHGLNLDSVASMLVADDERIAVTRLECLVLECLMRDINFPVPRYELIRYAWSDVESVDASNVNLAITRLRRKVSTRLPWLSIDTINRFGYQLTTDLERKVIERVG